MLTRCGQLTANAPGECTACGQCYPAATVRCLRCGAAVGTAELPPGDVLPRYSAEDIEALESHNTTRDDTGERLAAIEVRLADYEERLEAAESRIRALESERGRR